MLPIASLVQGSVADAVSWLAEKAAAARTSGLSWAEKQAAEAGGVLSSLGDAVSSNPVLGKALLGGGIGALAGAGQHMLSSDEDRKGRSLLSRAATGGLAGAALGGGVGAIQQSGVGAGIGKGVGNLAATGGKPAGSSFTAGGKTYTVDPSILKEDPNYLAKVQSLTSKPLHETAINKGLGFLFNNPIAPTMTPIMAGLGVADAATHNLQIGDKNWFAGAKHIPLVGKTLHDIGEKGRDTGWFPGMIDPKNSRDPEHMRLGLADAAKNDHNFARSAKDVVKAIDANESIPTGLHGGFPRRGHDIRDELAKNPGKGYDHLYPETEKDQLVPATKKVTTTDPLGAKSTVKTTEKVLRKVKGWEHQPITPELRGEAAQHGANLAAAETAKDPSYKNYNPTDKARIYRPGLGMKDRHLPIGALQGGRGLGRLAFYGLPIASEWALRTYGKDVGQSQTLQQMLAEARQKGHIREEGGN